MCDKIGCWSTKDTCDYRRRGFVTRPLVPDACTDGTAAADIFHRSVVRILPPEPNGSVWITIDDMNFLRGSASGLRFGANNCLIHTLQQAVADNNMPSIDAIIPSVRRSLLDRFPRTGVDAVTRDNFLVHDLHWEAIVDCLGLHARDTGFDAEGRIAHTSFTLVVVSEDRSAIASIEGTGPIRLYILNQGNMHYVPLLRRRYFSSMR